MSIQVIHCDICATETAKRLADIFLGYSSYFDYASASPGKVFYHNGLKIKLLKADRNIVVEALFSQIPVPLIIKFPNRNNRMARKAITWEAEQWRFVNSVLRSTGKGVIPAIISFDERSTALFVEKIEGVTIWQVLLRSPVINLFEKSKKQVLSKFSKLGKILAALHDNTASQQGVLFYSLEDKLDGVDRGLFEDKIFREGCAVFRHFYSKHAGTNWVHGNLRTDNVIFTGQDVLLIDFENAGAGDPMEDMGRLLAFIILFRRSAIFPRIFWREIMECLMQGYANGMAMRSPERLVACVLGEMLCVYGRNFTNKRLSLLDRRSKLVVAANIRHLNRLLEDRPDAFATTPSVLVTQLGIQFLPLAFGGF